MSLYYTMKNFNPGNQDARATPKYYLFLKYFLLFCPKQVAIHQKKQENL